MSDFVVDASVAIKLFTDEDLSPEARHFFARLETEPRPRFWVPDHFFIECANVLWKSVWRLGRPISAVQQDQADLAELPFDSVPTRELAAASLSLATEWRITAYDAAYLALSLGLGVPFLTADQILVDKVRGGPFEIVWLGTLIA